jgi:hypothetical protein
MRNPKSVARMQRSWPASGSADADVRAQGSTNLCFVTAGTSRPGDCFLCS